MNDIYTDGNYLKMTETWHAVDSQWKAEQIGMMLGKIDRPIASVAEIGCGAGRVLEELSRHDLLQSAKFRGYDVSPQAIELCESVTNSNIEFCCCDPLEADNKEFFDLLLVIDVFEHVPDYMGFLEKCKQKATFKIYHIPLDIHVSSVLRDSLTNARRSLGHLHYFTAKTAFATIQDTGHEITDYIYTNGALGLFKKHPSFKRAIANCPRWLVSRISVSLSARLFGGYSLLVLAK